jgi:hypothetical protein
MHSRIRARLQRLLYEMPCQKMRARSSSWILPGEDLPFISKYDNIFILALLSARALSNSIQ